MTNTVTQIDSESFSSSVIGICEMSLWTSNMTPPPWIFLSFLYTLYRQISGQSSEVAIELSNLVSRIATSFGCWKSRKASNSSFFASYAIDIHANEEQTYFQFQISPVHQRRNQKSWRIHISGKSMYSLYCSQFHTEFLQWISIHYGSTYHNCHTPLCDPLGQHHYKDRSQLYSLYNTKLRHQIQFLRVRCHQGLSMKRGSFFRIPHIQGVYPMPYSTFCISHVETWDLGSFRYPQPGW